MGTFSICLTLEPVKAYPKVRTLGILRNWKIPTQESFSMVWRACCLRKDAYRAHGRSAQFVPPTTYSFLMATKREHAPRVVAL
jgi:hypothetical protein